MGALHTLAQRAERRQSAERRPGQGEGRGQVREQSSTPIPIGELLARGAYRAAGAPRVGP